jgi:hypothetical protein
MSNKIKQIIDKLQQSNNLIQQQRKEIDKLKSMALSNIVNNYTTESEEEMIEPVAWRAIDRDKTLLTDDTEFILKMWKHNGFKIEPLYLLRELTEWEIKECWEEATEMREHFCSQYFDFAQLILKKASEK